MALSMYQASVPVIVQGLGSLSAILDKAGTHAASRNIKDAVLLGSRLYPDMFPLSRQVQLVSDFAKGTVGRLAGAEVPKFADAEASFAELRDRLGRTLDFVRGVDPAGFEGSDEREISLTIGSTALSFKGLPYLLHFALPQFWFHHATAYAILRHNGIELGKRDFVGSF